jgi:hypothetical protein
MASRKEGRVVRPHWLWFLLLDGGIVMLVQFVLNPSLYATVREKSGHRLPSQPVVQGLLAGTMVVHLGEAVAAGRMAKRRSLPRRGWVLQTFIVGFPSLLKLRSV